MTKAKTRKTSTRDKLSAPKSRAKGTTPRNANGTIKGKGKGKSPKPAAKGRGADPSITGKIETVNGQKHWPSYVKVYLAPTVHKSLVTRAEKDSTNLPTTALTLVEKLLAKDSFPRSAKPAQKRGDGTMVNIWMPAETLARIKEAAKKREVSPATFCTVALR